MTTRSQHHPGTTHAPRIGLALALLAGVASAQSLPGEHALLLDYETTSMQAGNGVNDLAAADLDGDGDLDVISVNSVSNRVRLLINPGSGDFTQQTLVVGGSPSAVAAADLDGDGDLDMVVGGWSQLHALLNDGTGHLTVGPATNLPAADRGAVTIIAHDVDGDGLLDALVGISNHALPSGSYTGSVLVAFGDGAGGLVPGPTHDMPLPVHHLVAADFNGDGQLDVASLGGYISASKVDIAFGTRAGGFVDSGMQFSAGLYASAIEQGDWDGDGDADLATGNKYTVSLFANDGAGGFVLGSTLNPGYYTKGLASGDIDLDGDIDLLATSGSSYAMRMYRNNGAGTFTLAATLPTSLQTISVMLADTNGDGYLDPWTGDYSTGQVTFGASRPLVASYGQAKLNSLGCLPTLTSTGAPAAGGAGLQVHAGKLIIDQPALVLAGLTPGALPGFGGTLLVLPPWYQAHAVTGHGAGNPMLCDGALSLSVDGAVLDALGVGTRVYVQVLSGDPGLPGAPQVSLTAGLWFEVSAP